MKYLSVTETAKLIRKRLKQEFPGQKFSVRSDSYSGGASIRIRYEDGPWVEDVEAVVKGFEGSGFDGMIDLKYSKASWLMPDGTVAAYRSSGTQGSMGVYESYEHDKPHPDAEPVHFGSDYVFVDREMSDEARDKAIKELEEWLGLEAGTFDQPTIYELPGGYDSEQGYVLVRQRFHMTGHFKHEHPNEIKRQAEWEANYQKQLAEEAAQKEAVGA